MSETKNYDLEERTAVLGENTIKLVRNLRATLTTEPIMKQLVRSATSIGANYMEANGASSKKDFLNKIYICKKESQETKHWLRMLSVALPEKKDRLRLLWQETQELTFIFHKIATSSKSKKNV